MQSFPTSRIWDSKWEHWGGKSFTPIKRVRFIVSKVQDILLIKITLLSTPRAKEQCAYANIKYILKDIKMYINYTQAKDKTVEITSEYESVWCLDKDSHVVSRLKVEMSGEIK